MITWGFGFGFQLVCDLGKLGLVGFYLDVMVVWAGVLLVAGVVW